MLRDACGQPWRWPGCEGAGVEVTDVDPSHPPAEVSGPRHHVLWAEVTLAPEPKLGVPHVAWPPHLGVQMTNVY